MHSIIAVSIIATLQQGMGIKYKVNEEFFDKWSSQMAYVLGLLYADGSLEDASYLRGKYIRLTSTDKELIFRVRRWLDSEHTIIYLKPDSLHGKQRYFLRIGSHKLYNSLTKLGLYPNKFLTIKFPNIPSKYLKDFIRGYFDGDGCVYLELSKNQNHNIVIKKLSIIFTSGSKKFLQGLNSAIKQILEVNQNNIYTSHRSFQLRYFTKDSIKVFKFMYQNSHYEYYLKRKFDIFGKYFKIRPSTIDRSIKHILMARW